MYKANVVYRAEVRIEKFCLYLSSANAEITQLYSLKVLRQKVHSCKYFENVK